MVEMQEEVVTSLLVAAAMLVMVKVGVVMVEVKKGVVTLPVVEMKLVVVMLGVETGKVVEAVTDTWHQCVAEV